MNVKLLKRVRDYIKAHPERYDQMDFCGTAYCVAGHACILSGGMTPKQLKDGTWSKRPSVLGREVLDLTEKEADRLFHATWSNVADGQFSMLSPEAGTRKGRSAIAVKRINHFLKTKGAE